MWKGTTGSFTANAIKMKPKTNQSGRMEPLIVEFEKKPAGSKAPNGDVINEPFYEVRYDFTLQRLAQAAAA